MVIGFRCSPQEIALVVLKGTKEDPILVTSEVVKGKQHFFREGGARCELAKKGTLRLAPTPQLEEALRRDYEKMREMYFGQEPYFDAVMTDIRELGRLFNERE